MAEVDGAGGSGRARALGPSAHADVLGGLIERLADCHDSSSFETLFVHYTPRLKAWGVRNGMASAVAEELAQETMLSVWRRAETFQPHRASASRWVFTIFRNKRIDYIRRNQIRETDLDKASHLASDADDPEASVALAGLAKLLRQAIDTLPGEQAKVLRKVYFESKSHRDVAAELNLPLGTVKSRIRLALARIRLAVDEQTFS